ncbi:putative transcriptional regulator containing an HTH domain fused to a Zn-ribbon [Halolamina pelagica]|uniref:Putative transcriptional regulator containing an HTH domain fused to a Zn-ribbon n=1 Tax=Halolamina pelagica TaxID=699431 RepID=A0A0N8I005_9EURY|nr:transcriptional regulator [Halolamina pelagica]KPN30963.1 putative transcriptional regulator containing an HTH domain fused to a Zn-ribbon [Halolamina pelagica]
MEEATTRQRIVDALREAPATPRELSKRLGVPTNVVYDHVRHVAKSLDTADEQLLVAPPTCKDCGFSGFDDPLAAPSRCPECKCERLTEPELVIESA